MSNLASELGLASVASGLPVLTRQRACHCNFLDWRMTTDD